MYAHRNTKTRAKVQAVENLVEHLIDELRIIFMPNLLSEVLGVAGTPAGLSLRGRISQDHVLLRLFRPVGRAEELRIERAQHANLRGRCGRPMHWLLMGDGAVRPKLLRCRNETR